MHQPPVARSTGGLYRPTTNTLQKRGYLLWTKSPKNIKKNSFERSVSEKPVVVGSNLCPGQTSLRSLSNIRLQPRKRTDFGADTFTGGVRTVMSHGSFVLREETWVDGSTYTVSRCSATRYTPTVLTAGGDPIMESRMYGLFAMAAALGAIVPSTSPKRGHNGI